MIAGSGSLAVPHRQVPAPLGPWRTFDRRLIDTARCHPYIIIMAPSSHRPTAKYSTAAFDCPAPAPAPKHFGPASTGTYDRPPLVEAAHASVLHFSSGDYLYVDAQQVA
jgi:hypothetical protein